MVAGKIKSRRGRPRPDARLTMDRLKEVLNYDPESGIFTWIKSISNRAPVGKIAGSPDQRGYIRITIDGEMFLARRLAWFYTYGAWPAADLDHKRGNKSDNRLAMLRPATRTQNNGNCKTREHNATGLKGVTWNKRRKKFAARIQTDGESRHLGYFLDAQEAHAAYLAAANTYFGEFANSGNVR